MDGGVRRVTGVRLAVRLPWALAVGWLAAPLAVSAQVDDGVAADRAALVALYNATDGVNWLDNTNWLSTEPLEDWVGVTTGADGRVTGLWLQSNEMSGALPAALGDLDKLESLQLGWNDLSGAIPAELGDLAALEELNLLWNDLSGAVPPALSSLTLLQTLDLYGNNQLSGPLPDGLRQLSSLSEMLTESTELCAPRDAAFQSWLATITFWGVNCQPAEQSVIDVAVFYTPQARDRMGGTVQIKTEIDLMVAETNQAYVDGEVNQRLWLAAAEEVAYTESGSMSTDLNRLRGTADGHMDTVHAVRDRVVADMVVLLADGVTGTALLKASASSAFAVVGVALGGYVFAHELGHIQGLHHDRYRVCDDEECAKPTYEYAYGYVNQQALQPGARPSARWRTIMAYPNQCVGFQCPRLLRFSNPNQVWPDPGGDSLGVPGLQATTAVDGPADAVRALNWRRETVANFRQATDVTAAFGADAYTAAEGGAAAAVTVSLSEAPGRPLVIPLTVANAGSTAADYSGVPAGVAFTADATERTFTVTAVDDAFDDDDESVLLGFGALLPRGVTVGSPAAATVTLVDNDSVAGAPAVAAVAVASDPGEDATYAIGETVEVTVVFNKRVTVTGAPQLGLTVGQNTRQAEYVRGVSEVLTFAWRVAEGDAASDGIGIAADSLTDNGGTIRDDANQDAVLGHAAVAADAGHKVDGVRPVLQEAKVDGAALTLTYGEALYPSPPPTSSFYVIAGFRGVVTGSVEVRGQHVLLTLRTRETVHGETVYVHYTPGTGPVRDAAGNAATALSREPVTNVTPQAFYDTDHNGLIDIATLAQLDAVRHDPQGDGEPTADGAAAYAEAFPDAGGERLRCGGGLGCRGYELVADLDFDINGDGRVDAGDDWWNGGAGWAPILPLGGYNSTFAGNGHAIRRLFVNRPEDGGVGDYVGLFGSLSSAGVIRHVALIEADVTGSQFVGALVGQNAGVVAGSYVTGRVTGTGSWIGGLVGRNFDTGTIRSSYSTARVSTTESWVGGLVGSNDGSIDASYATGRVSKASNHIGGLVGNNGNGAIAASYATGPVSGKNWTGGLVGRPTGESGDIEAGYWDSTTSNTDPDNMLGSRTTAQLQAPTDYAGLYATWNLDLDGDGASDDPWDFGTASEYPALKVDFGGDGLATWQEFGRQLRHGPTVTALPGDPGQVVLTWTPVEVGHWTPAPAVRYTVYRDGAAIAANVNVHLHTDSGLTLGGTFTYQVAAVVAGNEATRSGPVAGTAGAANQPPEAVGTLPALTLPIAAGATTIDVSHAFQDPEDDELTYDAKSSNVRVATASAADSAVTLTPVSAGSSTVTVTATDVAGSNTPASQRFTVVVPNRPPFPVGSLAGGPVLQVGAGNIAVLNVLGAFNDPDNDTLTYYASSSAPGVLEARASGPLVTLTPVAGGMRRSR